MRLEGWCTSMLLCWGLSKAVIVSCPRRAIALRTALPELSIFDIMNINTYHVQSIRVRANAYGHVHVVDTKYCLTPNPNAKQP